MGLCAPPHPARLELQLSNLPLIIRMDAAAQTAQAQLRLVHYYLDNELNANALFVAERLHAQDPEDHTWSHLRALSCLRLGRHTLAADFSRNAATDGHHLGCAYVHAQACLHLKTYAEGIDVLSKRQLLGRRNSPLAKTTQRPIWPW